MSGPVFRDGERVTLRPLEREDLPFVRRNVNRPSVRRPLERDAPANAERLSEWFERTSADDDSLALLVTAGETPVGFVSLTVLNRTWGNASLSFWVTPDEQGNGYGTEAVELTAGYAFDQRRLHKLLAHVFAFNDASARLLERLGFEREGVHRREVYVDGEFHALYAYGLLASEWRDGQEAPAMEG